MTKPGGISSGTVIVTAAKPQAIIAGATYGLVRVTMRNVGGPAVRIGPDNTVSFLAPTNAIAIGGPADNGLLIPPGDEQVFTQPGSLAVWAIAAPGVGGANDGVVSQTIVDWLVEVLE